MPAQTPTSTYRYTVWRLTLMPELKAERREPRARTARWYALGDDLVPLDLGQLPDALARTPEPPTGTLRAVEGGRA